jgi:hypothetical protein
MEKILSSNSFFFKAYKQFYNLCLVGNNRYFLSIFILAIVGTLAFPINLVMGQPTRTFTILFTSVVVHGDHDPSFSGEWDLWTRVSDLPLVSLSAGTGLDDVDDGNTVLLNKQIRVTIPENGAISLLVFGVERDDPPFDPDDGVGVISKSYALADNFGMGFHDELSQFNGREADSAGDYSLQYVIFPS